MPGSRTNLLPIRTRWYISQCRADADGECMRRSLMNMSLINDRAGKYASLFKLQGRRIDLQAQQIL